MLSFVRFPSSTDLDRELNPDLGEVHLAVLDLLAGAGAAHLGVQDQNHPSFKFIWISCLQMNVIIYLMTRYSLVDA